MPSKMRVLPWGTLSRTLNSRFFCFFFRHGTLTVVSATNLIQFDRRKFVPPLFATRWSYRHASVARGSSATAETGYSLLLFVEMK